MHQYLRSARRGPSHILPADLPTAELWVELLPLLIRLPEFYLLRDALQLPPSDHLSHMGVVPSTKGA